MKIAQGRKLQLLQLLRDHGARAMYGQEILEATGLPMSTVYVNMHRMTKDGWVEAWDEKEAGQPGIGRRYYKLTADGVRALNAGEAASAILNEALPEPTGG